MKWNWDTADRVVFFVGMAVGIAFLTALSALLVKAASLSSTEWASWVQAVGSVGAIIGAALIAGDGRRQDREERLRDLLRREIKAVNRVKSIADSVLLKGGAMNMSLDGRHPEPINDAIATVDDCQETLKKALEGIDEAGGVWVLGNSVMQQIPLVTAKARSLLERCLEMREIEKSKNEQECQKGREAVVAALRDFNRVFDRLILWARELRELCVSFIANPELAAPDL